MNESSNVSVEEAATEFFFGERYLRRRPFLIVRHIMRPAPDVRTETKGWMDVPGQVAHFENPSIVDRVSNNHLRDASVIVDILNRKLVKCRFLEHGTEEQIVNHYMGKYAEQITEGLRVWAERSALDISAKTEQ